MSVFLNAPPSHLLSRNDRGKSMNRVDECEKHEILAIYPRQHILRAYEKLSVNSKSPFFTATSVSAQTEIYHTIDLAYFGTNVAIRFSSPYPFL